MRYMIYVTDDAFHIICRSAKIKMETLFTVATEGNEHYWDNPVFSYLECDEYDHAFLFHTPFEYVTKHDYIRLIGWYDPDTGVGRNADMFVKVSEIKYG